MTTVYLICFVLGFVLSLLAAFTGLGRVHFGHVHFGHAHTRVHGHAKAGGQMSALNGITLPAFLCWFGGAGYLLHQYSSIYGPLVFLLAALSGLVGAGILYVAMFRFLIPHERVLSAEDTRMEGVVAHVSDEIRPGGTGEILFSQADARRSAAARSESGDAIARGTEVVVLRYVRGVAYVSPLNELLASGDLNRVPGAKAP
jgi:membrane protein implicated in regulation of membrane protease activity